MIGRRMPHVVYRSFGFARTVLGAAKKIDLTTSENGRRVAEVKAGDRRRTTGSWSRRCSTFCARVSPGATFRHASAHGVRSTPGSDDGVRRAFGAECSPNSVPTRSAGFAVSIAPISRCIETELTQSEGSKDRRWEGRRADSTRSWRQLWTPWDAPSVSISRPGRSTICERARRCSRHSTAVGPSLIEDSIPMPFARASREPERWSACRRARAAAPSTTSTGPFTGIAIRSKTSLPESNAIAASRHATRSWSKPFSVSFPSPRCSIGSLMRFKDTP